MGHQATDEADANGRDTRRSGRWQFGPFSAEWDFGPRRGGRHGEGRGARRFTGDELRLVLLKLIADAPSHGYELIKAIEERTAHGYAPSPGVVYPSLTLLGDMELIEEQPGGGSRKRYAVTPAGATHLVKRADEVTALMARLGGLGRERDRADRAPVRRAMANLRFAVQERVFRDDLDADTSHAVAALIDEAAQKIERLK